MSQETVEVQERFIETSNNTVNTQYNEYVCSFVIVFLSYSRFVLFSYNKVKGREAASPHNLADLRTVLT